ncbi:MAG: hypothetical protein RLZZ136_1067 [Pseudomonadota bacterium]
MMPDLYSRGVGARMTGHRICIFGASGGIGAALCTLLAQADDVERIYAGGRGAGGRGADVLANAKVQPFTFDLLDEASIAAAAEAIAADGPLDLVIVATGVLQNDALSPERTWRAIDPEAMQQVFAINTIGPALIAKHMLPHLRRNSRSVFATLSAKVGSISDNGLGGWHSYRASKAALNMLVRNFAIELKQRNSKAVAVALHPGTVDTDLSKPFQRGVAAEKLFTPERCAAQLLAVIAGLTAVDSGHLLGWDGAQIPF